MTSLSHSPSRLLVWLLACCAFDSPGRLELQVNLSQADSCLWGNLRSLLLVFSSSVRFDYVHLLSSSSTYCSLPITARGRRAVYLTSASEKTPRLASPTLSTIRPAPLTTTSRRRESWTTWRDSILSCAITGHKISRRHPFVLLPLPMVRLYFIMVYPVGAHLSQAGVFVSCPHQIKRSSLSREIQKPYINYPANYLVLFFFSSR